MAATSLKVERRGPIIPVGTSDGTLGVHHAPGVPLMLVTKLVIRILDGKGDLLGWAEAIGEARGDGKITVTGPTVVGIEMGGEAEFLSVHWCDVNVEIRSPMVRSRMRPGQLYRIPGEWPAITCGPAAGGLPPVTVSTPVVVQCLPGGTGMRG